MGKTLTPNLWFDDQAEAAAAFYVSVFDNSRILNVLRNPPNSVAPEGTVLTVEFELEGNRFVGINGCPAFAFSEAVSFEIDCADQQEVDYYWDALGDGGRHDQCGWLKDRYGLSWQIVPTELIALLSDPDRERAGRAMQAMRCIWMLRP